MISQPIKVLFIHHSGVFGGASRSLLELIKSFPENSVDPVVLLPIGSASLAFDSQNIKTIKTIKTSSIAQFDNTSYGHYRGFRWLVILRELFLLPSTFIAIKKAKKESLIDFDLIHINEITNLPSVLFASKIFKKPIVLHIRSLQRSPKSIRNKIIYKILKKYVKISIAIDETVAKSLPHDLPKKIIHNGFDPLSSLNDNDENVKNSITKLKGKLKVVIVGNLLFMKGIVEFVKAAKLAKDNNLMIDFIIVGDKPAEKKGVLSFLLKIFGLSHDAKQFVLDYIEKHQLQDFVHLIKFTSNITSVYDNIDVLCFPSHLNAVGRPVFEAAFLSKPSIVAIKDPMRDTVIHMQTGLCIEEKKPEELFNAIKYMHDHPIERNLMGHNSLLLAEENFNIKNNANKTLQVYNDLLM